MRILLDECVPWPMHKLLVGHECTTAQKRGWGGIKNGDLRRLLAAAVEIQAAVVSSKPGEVRRLDIP